MQGEINCVEIVCQNGTLLGKINDNGERDHAMKKFSLAGFFIFAFLLMSFVSSNPAFAQIDPLTGQPYDGGGSTVPGTLPQSNMGGSNGGTIAKQTCDTQVWRTMEARSRLEMEREMMQNQNLIFKPDSVLSYTCFDSFAAHASKNVGPIFTHNESRWGKLIIQWGAPEGMDNAIQKSAVDAMKSFTEKNFDHAFLGGRGQIFPDTQDVGNKGRDYTCNYMQQVWSKAKCMNFLHTQQFAMTDGFYPFLNLQAEQGGQSVEGYEGKNDIRKYPTECKDSKPFIDSTWKDMYLLSRNENSFGNPNKLYEYGVPLQKAFQDVRKMVEPGQCGKPVKTGVKVILSAKDSTPYDDGVCTNPGCTLPKGGSGDCQKSQ